MKLSTELFNRRYSVINILLDDIILKTIAFYNNSVYNITIFNKNGSLIKKKYEWHIPSYKLKSINSYRQYDNSHTQHGIQINLGYNGAINRISNYYYGNRHGISIEWFTSGALYTINNYKYGNYHKSQLEWFPNGLLKEYLYYNRGTICRQIMYISDGTLIYSYDNEAEKLYVGQYNDDQYEVQDMDEYKYLYNYDPGYNYDYDREYTYKKQKKSSHINKYVSMAVNANTQTQTHIDIGMNANIAPNTVPDINMDINGDLNGNMDLDPNMDIDIANVSTVINV